MRQLSRNVQAWRRIAVLGSVASFLLGMVLGLSILLISQPNCPTEDSCYVDYRNGQWHVLEGSREDIPMR